ncbi:hypothetical protein [Streptomyces sp. SID13031]|nr:hypothetical protein [Streptomyces sp. SID13031]NEA33318.1 hypothetical protein [Streptomyces sp. SID13031]
MSSAATSASAGSEVSKPAVVMGGPVGAGVASFPGRARFSTARGLTAATT